MSTQRSPDRIVSRSVPNSGSMRWNKTGCWVYLPYRAEKHTLAELIGYASSHYSGVRSAAKDDLLEFFVLDEMDDILNRRGEIDLDNFAIRLSEKTFDELLVNTRELGFIPCLGSCIFQYGGKLLLRMRLTLHLPWRR